VERCQFYIDESVRGRHEWTLRQDDTLSHIAWNAMCDSECAISHTALQRRENVACIKRDTCPQQPGFNSPGLSPVHHAIWSESIYHGNTLFCDRWSVEASDRTVLQWRALPMTMRFIDQRLMETSFAVCRESKWQTHWTHISLDGWCLSVCPSVACLDLTRARTERPRKRKMGITTCSREVSK